MVRYEWKKILLYRGGIWLIAGLLILELVSIVLFTPPYDRELENNRAVYDRYLAEVEGPLTQEKRDFLEAEMERLNRIHREMEELKSDYYSGGIPEDAYRERFRALLSDDEKYEGFTCLYRQYIFVREDSRRGFLYTGGWESLLNDQAPDYLLLLALVILLAPVFCGEYACRMDALLLTQKKSARCQASVKLTAALLLTAVLAASVQGMELTFRAVRFGLPHWEYSLQSLPSFGKAEKAMSLGQAFLLQFALKEMGYLLTGVMILFFSVCLKKLSLTLMAGIVALPLPLLTVPGKYAFLRIPGPWALTVGSIYLNGGKQEMDFAGLGIYLLTVGGVAAMLLAVIRQRNTNRHLLSRRIKTVTVLAALALLLTGCASSAPEKLCCNALNSDWCETDGAVILGGPFDQAVIRKDTGDILPFPLDALAGETLSARGCLFPSGGNIYYIQTETVHPRAGNPDKTEPFSVLEKLETGKMERSVVHSWKEETTWFFGLLDRNTLDKTLPQAIEWFFLYDGGMYYLDSSQEGLFRRDLTTGKQETVLDRIHGVDLSWDGENLYYTDDYNRLVIRNFRTGSVDIREDVVTDKFILTPEGILFRSRRDGNALCFRGPDGVRTLSKRVPAKMWWDSRYLWFSDTADNTWRIAHDGTGETLVSFPGRIRAVPSGKNLYLYDFENGSYYMMDKDTLQIQPLTETGSR